MSKRIRISVISDTPHVLVTSVKTNAAEWAASFTIDADAFTEEDWCADYGLVIDIDENAVDEDDEKDSPITPEDVCSHGHTADTCSNDCGDEQGAETRTVTEAPGPQRVAPYAPWAGRNA